jgi:hypothetical protein
VQALPGVGRIEYDQEQDLFFLEYDAARIKAPDILAAVILEGRKIGRDYRPRIIS